MNPIRHSVFELTVTAWAARIWNKWKTSSTIEVDAILSGPVKNAFPDEVPFASKQMLPYALFREKKRTNPRSVRDEKWNRRLMNIHAHQK